jgi:hypothetical protein
MEVREHNPGHNTVGLKIATMVNFTSQSFARFLIFLLISLCSTVSDLGAQSNFSPTLNAINPASVGAGSGNTTITLTGTGFVPGSVVRINGTAVTTNFINSATLTAVIPASFLASSASLGVSVFNPDTVQTFWEEMSSSWVRAA